MKLKSIIMSVAMAASAFGAQAANDALLNIDGVDIPKDEFVRIYNKNKAANFYGDKQSLEQYMDLYVNYRLKVDEAKRLQFDTLPKFQKEVNQYINKIAAPYLIDESVDEKLVVEAYERLKTELHVKFILIKVSPFAVPADTVAAYKRALNVRNRILSGEDFGKVAQSASDMPGVDKNGGDIGFITTFASPYAFENIAYSLNVGELSMPTRTNDGYYIVKVVEKRASMGEVHVAHLMLSADLNKPSSEINAVKETADSIYEKLKSGADWNQMVQQYSSDKRSAMNNGEMPWFDATWNLPSSFLQASFDLKVGEISKPVRTNYGWHIIKLLDKRSLQPLDSIRGQIQNKISRDQTRSTLSHRIVIDRLKSNYNLQHSDNVMLAFAQDVDTTIYQGKWEIPSNIADEVLITYADQKIKLLEFAKWLQKSQKGFSAIADKSAYLYKMLDAFETQTIIDYEIRQLPSKNADFADLYNEYYDGMLLFEVTDYNVWSKSSKDSVGLAKYYEQHKNEYMWGERVKVNLYNCVDSATLVQTKALLTGNSKKKPSQSDVLKKVNGKSGDKLIIETKIYAQGDNKQIDSYEWTVGKIYESGNVLVEIVENVKPSPKDLKSCRGAVISDYQAELEKKWIADLRAKHKITINQEVLNTIK